MMLLILMLFVGLLPAAAVTIADLFSADKDREYSGSPAVRRKFSGGVCRFAKEERGAHATLFCHNFITSIQQKHYT
ncbi:MAG: hypothetical protein LBI96_03945, partial [Odoribacteraceae bacterium]|nr:hypothetical protein [Odoribacteraceae bacterium]